MFTHPSQNMDLSDLFKDNSVNFSVMHKSYSEILLVMLRRKLHIESTLPRNSFHRLTGQRKIMSGMTPPISQRRLLSNNSVKMFSVTSHYIAKISKMRLALLPKLPSPRILELPVMMPVLFKNKDMAMVWIHVVVFKPVQFISVIVLARMFPRSINIVQRG